MDEKTFQFESGYIAYSLQKKYKKMKESSTSKAILNVIESWATNREENLFHCGLMEYTKEWTKKVNQGGLCEVKDRFYMLLREVEILGRDYLNTELIKSISRRRFKNCSDE